MVVTNTHSYEPVQFNNSNSNNSYMEHRQSSSSTSTPSSANGFNNYQHHNPHQSSSHHQFVDCGPNVGHEQQQSHSPNRSLHLNYSNQMLVKHHPRPSAVTSFNARLTNQGGGYTLWNRRQDNLRFALSNAFNQPASQHSHLMLNKSRSFTSINTDPGQMLPPPVSYQNTGQGAGQWVNGSGLGYWVTNLTLFILLKLKNSFH
jgi:hypothetical protein